MKAETKRLLEIIERVIETTEIRQKNVAERYISLINKRLHEDKKNFYEILGASLALEDKWRDKFGEFIPRPEPIRDGNLNHKYK